MTWKIPISEPDTGAPEGQGGSHGTAGKVSPVLVLIPDASSTMSYFDDHMEDLFFHCLLDILLSHFQLASLLPHESLLFLPFPSSLPLSLLSPTHLSECWPHQSLEVRKDDHQATLPSQGQFLSASASREDREGNQESWCCGQMD